MLLMQSCATTKIEYVRDLPELSWPEFPIIQSQYLENENKILLMLDDFISIAEFKIDYETLKQYYNELQEKK